MKHFWFVALLITAGFVFSSGNWNKFPIKNSTFRCLRKSFSWLCEDYGFTETDFQSVGSWYFITYRNAQVEVKVVFDLRLSEPPLTIRIHQVDCWGLPCGGKIWERQYDRKSSSDQSMIEDTARWLRHLISSGEIDYTKC